MDLPLEFLNPELLKNILGDALTGEFVKTCSIFSLAAYVHSKQVRKEIKMQFGALISVLQMDLDAQKKTLGLLYDRVDTIERHLNIKGE